MKRLSLVLLLAGVFVTTSPFQALAKKKKEALSLPSLMSDSLSAYKKLIKGADKKVGLFTVYFNKEKGDLYFELPDSAFSKTYMIASRISSTSDGSDYVAGQMNVSPFAVRFSTDGRSVFMHEVTSINTIDPKDPIRKSFEDNNLDPVLVGFKVAAKHGKNILIDVTRFFCSNEKSISPLKNSSPIGKLLGMSDGIKGTFVSEASGIVFAKSFPQNIEIESMLSYQTTGIIQKPYSVTVHRSIFALPEVSSMPVRFQDNRVGYFYNDKNIFSSDKDRIEEKSYINRWNLRPKKEDMDKYFAGELVEPEKPIVFYVDSAFPEKWRGTIKEGIEVWNKAFEAAGFKHAIRALDYPKNDSLFDPDDMRYSCFRYVATNTANAMGPSYVDPRTGEILSANVIWYHNIVSLLHNWRFVQTGAVDSRVRKETFDDSLMCESIKYAASHEIGHTLGLMHNMGASYSFPVEKLRDPAFTQKYGTTPSIMDYARNNYVAQPGDMERGVKLTPPELGVYDIYAINWGYRIIKGANTPEAEKSTLDKWIAEKANDPMYEFGAQQVFSTIDPTDLTEDLGNDHIKAGNYGIGNLKVLMKNFENWTMQKGERYDESEKIYMEVTKQYGRYIKHVIPYIGGIRYEEIRQGDNKLASKNYIGKMQQKQALAWLLNQMRTYDSWLTPKSLINKLEVDLNVNDKLRSQTVSSLLNASVLYRVREGGELNPTTGYKLEDYLNDFTNLLFTAPKGGELAFAEQSLESTAITQMLKTLTPASTATSSSTDIAASDQMNEGTADEDFCTYRDDSFFRVNMGVSALNKDEMGAIMMGRLQKVLQKYRTYRAAAQGLSRDYYNYQILRIEKALSNK